jgi:hypothetical protein
MLTVRGRQLPGGAVKIWYLEAFCRPGSTDHDGKGGISGWAHIMVMFNNR